MEERNEIYVLLINLTIPSNLEECVNSGMDYWNTGMEIFKSLL